MPSRPFCHKRLSDSISWHLNESRLAKRREVDWAAGEGSHIAGKGVLWAGQTNPLEPFQRVCWRWAVGEYRLNGQQREGRTKACACTQPSLPRLSERGRERDRDCSPMIPYIIILTRKARAVRETILL